MVKKPDNFVMSSTDDDDEDFMASGDTDSLHSLAKPLLKREDSERNKKPRKHVLSDRLFAERNKRLAKACVMLTVTLERTAYYGLLGNLAYFANVFLDYTADESVYLTLVFAGITWISCFIGGILGDAILGRFRTIIIGLIFYILGYLNLSIIAHYIIIDHENHDNILKGRTTLYVVWFLGSLLFISLGEGCFKSNMSSFGADQIDSNSDNSEMRSFFNYFYWAVNFGSLIGFSLIIWIQNEHGFCIGYIVPCSLLGLAALVFLLPRKINYHISSPKQNVVLIIKIIWNAWTGDHRLDSTYEEFNPMDGRLDRAKIKYGGRFLDSDVDDVKVLVSLLPTLLFLIIYCSCYYQVNGLFLMQGIHMKLPQFSQSKGGGGIPAAWFQLFNVVTVLVMVPLVDKFVYPRLDKLFERAPHLCRMALGMVFASLAMISAGVVEQYRESDHFGNTTNKIDANNIKIMAKDMDIWYQIPQYVLLGISEIFVLITGLEFAYCRAPRSMQSFVTSLFFVVNGFGALLTTLLIRLGNLVGLDFIRRIKQPNLDKPVPHLKGHLYRFFYSMAVLNLVNTMAFIVYTFRKSRKRKRRDLERTVAAFIQSSYEDSLRSSPASNA